MGQVRDRVRAIQAERGISGAELARRADISQQVLYKALRGEQTFSMEQVWSIAHGLGVDPARLLPLDRPSVDPYEAAVIVALRSGDPVKLAAALDDAGAPLRAEIAPAEAALLAAVRAGDPAVALLELARALDVPVDQLAGDVPRPNPSGPISAAGLREVGDAAAHLVQTIRRVVPDDA